MKPTHLDLFSGIGGFTIAAEAAGFKTVAFCEIEPMASLVLKAHWPDVPNLKDVTKLCRRAYDCEPENEEGQCICPRCNTDFGDCECVGTYAFTDEFGFPDLVTGGVPCQPASSLGQMRGTADERWLWPEVIRIMRELRPRFGVFENPPSILVLEGGRAWNGIVSGLVEIGYDCWWDVFPAAAFGAGHLRERVLLVVTDRDQRANGLPGLEQERSRIRGRSLHENGEVPVANPASKCERIAPDQTNTKPAFGNTRSIFASSPDWAASNNNNKGLQGHAGDGAGSGEERRRGENEGRHIATPDLRERVRDFGNGLPWWHEANTGIPVLAHGLSSKLVEAATRCAGNAIVPQVAYQILKPIATCLNLNDLTN